MIHQVDLDGNGTIDLAEFLTMMLRREKEIRDHGDFQGFLTRMVMNSSPLGSSIYQVMNQLGEKLTMEEVDKMMKMADVNGDGLVNFEG